MIFGIVMSLLLSIGLSSAVGASEHLLSHPASTFRSPAAPVTEAATAEDVFFSLAKAESRLSDCDCFSAEKEAEEKEEFLKALEKLSEPLLGRNSVMPWNLESN